MVNFKSLTRGFNHLNLEQPVMYSGNNASSSVQFRLPCQPILPGYEYHSSCTSNFSLDLVKNNDFYQKKLDEIICSMKELHSKESAEKDTFLCDLPTLVKELLPETVLEEVLPLLTRATESGTAGASALIPILEFGVWLSPEKFAIQVVPALVKFFTSNNEDKNQYGDSEDVDKQHVTEVILRRSLIMLCNLPILMHEKCNLPILMHEKQIES